MSSTVRPARSSRRGTAKTGPIPISSGSQPATAKPRKAPSGVTPSRAARSPSITTSAAAPSDSWLAFPAVMNLSSPLTGFRPASPSIVVDGRLHSSPDRVKSSCVVSFVVLSITARVTPIGTISSANLPACCAAAIRCCERSEYSSCAARLTP